MKNQQTNKTQQTTNTTKKEEGKRYLQQEIEKYLTDNDSIHLSNIAYIIVKKTCFHYSMTSTQGDLLFMNARRKNTDNADIKDLRQECITSILQTIANNEKDTNKIIKNAFSGVNTYLYHLRSIKLSNRPFEYSIEELSENGIQLVNIRKGLYKMFKDNEYIDDYTDTDNDIRIKQRKIIYKILKELTPIQKQVVKMLAFGNSYSQIAIKMNRSKSCIQQHIIAIRKIANKIEKA